MSAVEPVPGRRQSEEPAPAISIIIPSYRDSQYIGEAINSVMAQSFGDYEILVVNDGSPDTDELERVLEQYEGRIIYIKQQNLGCSAARNVAIRAARGQFIAFLDADDYWSRDFLAEQKRFLDENPTIDLVYTDALHVGDSPLAGCTFMQTTPSNGDVTFESLLAGECTVILSGVVTRRQAVVEAGLFDESLHYAEDYDLWLRMAQQGSRLAYQRKVLVCKRMHQTNASSNLIKLFESALFVLDRTERSSELTDKERAALRQRVTTIEAGWRLEQGKAKLCHADFSAAAEDIRASNNYYQSRRLKILLLGLRFSPRLLLRAYNIRDHFLMGTKTKYRRRVWQKEKALQGTTDSAKEKPYPDERVEEDQGAGSLVTRAAWILFAKTVAFALSFVLPLLLVRRLSQHEFGLYKQVFLVIGTALTMLPLGFGMSAYYFLPRERDRRGLIVWNVLIFYAFMAGVACLALWLRPELLGSLFQSVELIEYAPMIGIAILFWVLSSFLEVVSVAHQEARLATVFIIISQFTKGMLLLAAALLFGSIEALIYAAILQGVLQTLIMFFYLRSRFPRFWSRFDWPVMRGQLSYAVPLGLSGVLFTIQLELHSYFVANRFDAATFAIYAVGCFQLPLVGILSESICSVMIPRLSFLQKQKQSREIIELTARVMRKLATIYFPLYVFLMIAGREFIAVLFTDLYLASWPIFAINLSLLPVSILVLDPVLRAYAEQRYFVLRLRFGLIVMMIVALWFATTYIGLIGIISVVVFINLIERVVTAIRMSRIVGVTRRDIILLKDVGKLAMCSAAAGLVAVAAKMYMGQAPPLKILVITAAIFSLAYLSIFLLSGILTRDEWSFIHQQISRLRRLPRRPATSLIAKGDV